MRRLVIAACVTAIVGACMAASLPARKASKDHAVSVSVPTLPKSKSMVRQTKASKATSLVILYTSSAHGQIRSCNCSKFRYGGYGRELSLIKSIRSNNSDVLLIEGGDITGGSGFQAVLKTGVAAHAIKTLGYEAMVPGDEDIGITGEQAIKRFEGKASPLICANLYGSGGKSLKYAPYVVRTTSSGLRVGVVGLMDSAIGGELLRKSTNLTITDPLQSLKRVLPTLQKRCDMVVAVYHGTLASGKKLAAAKGIDLLLCTHRSEKRLLFPSKDSESNEVTAPVEKQGSVYVISAGTNENWSLGMLDMPLHPSMKIKSVSHKLLFLDRRYPEDPQMVKVYDKYNESVTNAVLSQSKKLKKQAEVTFLKRGLNPDDVRKRLRKSPFALSETCKTCHADIYDSWSKTRHSNAMASLKGTKQEYDPECVSCHVTGASTRNGYTNIKETPELVNVQCEACHGAALKHTKSPAAGFGKLDEQVCRSCHTTERDPEFDYDAYWAKIKH